MRTKPLPLFLFSLLLLGACASPPGEGGLLDGLSRVRPGRSRRVSSAAPEPESNWDNLRLAPGKTRVLADIQGPAVITHIWLTFNEARPNWISKAGSARPDEIVLRMYWDGAKEPAVEAPLGDFFAAGFGLRREVKSIPVQVESGDGYNCFWRMPFFKRGLITITNESDKYLNSFYYHVDYQEKPSLPEDTAYFCAQYRREFPEKTGRDYLVLDAAGKGHYVGTVISVRTRSPYWFGEGDDKFYIDGEKRPSIWGTGTEDYFLSAWGLEECSFPCFGCTYMEGEHGGLGTRYCLYRWHLHDPIRFTRSLRFELEHKGWITGDETTTGKVNGHVEREDDIASVAFWYQVGQPKRFTTLPPLKERIFPNLDIVVPGKDLFPGARRSEGEFKLQAGWGWSPGGQVFFKNTKPGGFLEVDFPVKKEEYRGLVLRLTRSYDYGVYRILLDGKVLRKSIDLYSKKTKVEDAYLGSYTLAKGKHTLRFECLGKNPFSRNFYLGLDSVRLRERWHKKRVPLRPKHKRYR